jgi:NRPS condensation-like uncharacterized protein
MDEPNMLRKLGIFERALLRSDQHLPFNVVGSLELENPPPPEKVHTALSLLQRRHPFLQAKIVNQTIELLPNSIIVFNVIQRQNDTQWMDIVENEMNTRLELSTGLFRVNYLYQERRAELILTFHHTIIDATSGMNLINELMSACASELELPALDVTPAAEMRFPPAYQGWRGVLAQMKYMAGQMGDEISYQWRMRGKRKAPVHLGGRGFINTMSLPESLVDKLSRGCRREKITLNSLLQAALMLAVNRVIYHSQALPMRIFSFSDLRPYTIPPTAPVELGNYITMMRYTIDAPAEKNIWQVAREIHIKIYHSLKSGEKFSAELLSETLMKMIISMKSARMAVTAINYSGLVNLDLHHSDIRVLGLHAFNSSLDLGPEVGSQARLFNNRLIWDFMFLESDMNRESAAKILEVVYLILENTS